MSSSKIKLLIVLVILFSLTIVLAFLTLVFNQNGKQDKQKENQTVPSPTKIPISYPKQSVRKGGGLESEAFQKWNTDFINSHPLLQKLPISSPYFGVEYLSEEHIVVHSKTSDKQRDYEHVKAWLDDLRISYRMDISKIKVEYK